MAKLNPVQAKERSIVHVSDRHQDILMSVCRGDVDLIHISYSASSQGKCGDQHIGFAGFYQSKSCESGSWGTRRTVWFGVTVHGFFRLTG